MKARLYFLFLNNQSTFQQQDKQFQSIFGVLSISTTFSTIKSCGTLPIQQYQNQSMTRILGTNEDQNGCMLYLVSEDQMVYWMSKEEIMGLEDDPTTLELKNKINDWPSFRCKDKMDQGELAKKEDSAVKDPQRYQSTTSSRSPAQKLPKMEEPAVKEETKEVEIKQEQPWSDEDDFWGNAYGSDPSKE